MTTLADIQTRRAPARSTWTTWLRWIAVLPSALVASSLTESLVRAVSAAVLGLTVSDIVSPFFVGAAFVMAGGIVAPRRKVETAVVLIMFSGLLTVIAVAVFSSGTEVSWLKVRVHSEAVWVAALGSIVWVLGVLSGLHWIRQDVSRNAGRSSG